MEKPIGRIAVFWDRSFLWGLMAHNAFLELGVDFSLLTGEDIIAGALEGHDAVFVPGGWASDKIRALGDEGAGRMRDFVRSGGGYLGVCGGAGLALTHDSGLGLAPFGRLPSSIRVPSFSGRIELERSAPEHAMWEGIPEGTAFTAWWPGQFALDGVSPDAVRVLARYGEPVEGRAYVTDLPVVEGVDWALWEKSYGINLDPARLEGEPAVVETSYGDGRVILSYPHFETAGDFRGRQVLVNLLAWLAPGSDTSAATAGPAEAQADSSDELLDEVAAEIAAACQLHATPFGEAAEALATEITEFINFGNLNFLWTWQAAMVLKWRRGVRGIEYSTLHAMLNKLSELAHLATGSEAEMSKMTQLLKVVMPFLADARRLVMLERFAMSRGPLSPLKTDDPDIQELREKLFSTTKRCGGQYEQIVDLADGLLLPLLRSQQA